MSYGRRVDEELGDLEKGFLDGNRDSGDSISSDVLELPVLCVDVVECRGSKGLYSDELSRSSILDRACRWCEASPGVNRGCGLTSQSILKLLQLEYELVGIGY